MLLEPLWDLEMTRVYSLEVCYDLLLVFYTTHPLPKPFYRSDTQPYTNYSLWVDCQPDPEYPLPTRLTQT